MGQGRSNDLAASPKPAVRSGVRRDELIEAAARNFAEKGYAQTSIQDIAESMGMLKGSLYYYIDTKEDLLFEVIHSTMVTWQELARSVRDSAAPTLDRLRTYIHRNIEGSLAARDRTAVFIHDFQNLSPERRRVILDLRHEHDGLLRELIQTAKDEKLISNDVNVKLVALAILTMSGSLYRWYDPAGSLSSEAIAEQLTQFVLRGVCAT